MRSRTEFEAGSGAEGVGCGVKRFRSRGLVAGCGIKLEGGGFRVKGVGCRL